MAMRIPLSSPEGRPAVVWQVTAPPRGHGVCPCCRYRLSIVVPRPASPPADHPLDIIMNAGSGRGGVVEAARRIEHLLAEAGRPGRMTLARHGRDIRPAAERAVKEGTSGLIAAGGDGTVN